MAMYLATRPICVAVDVFVDLVGFALVELERVLAEPDVCHELGTRPSLAVVAMADDHLSGFFRECISRGFA